MLLAGLTIAAVAVVVVVIDLYPWRVQTDEQKLWRIEELYSGYRASFPDVPGMTVEELVSAQAAGDVVVVDVREQAEREVSMIPEAVSVRQFEADGQRYAGKQVVVYCTIGYRSGLHARKLNESGQAVANLKGGILAWVHAGQAVTSTNGRTNRVHVYGREWNLLPSGYEAVW
jgi:sodium/bile acid cotransporter 7